VTSAEGQPQVVTVIDSDERVMAVYHVDRSTGEITLKSVRNMTWDLQMLEFNSGEPLPQEIRDMRRGLQP
jgi:predicted methyltransferase